MLTRNRIVSLLKAKQRTIASAIVAVMLFNGLLAVSRAVDPNDTTDVAGRSLVDPTVTEGPTPGTVVLPDGTVVPANSKAARKALAKQGLKPKDVVDKTKKKLSESLVPGVTDDTITVVYYWKGERTMTSSYIGGTPAEGANLDEALAFRRYIEFINKHESDGTTFMGIPINLHGRKLKGIVLEAGNGDFSYAQTAEKIAEEIKPFAAIAAHGGLSTYICPRLADAKIFNLQTYDLGGIGGNLVQRTNDYCVGSGLTWERQIDLTIGYLKKQMHEPTTAGQERKYGFLYSLYPGLKDSGPAVIQKLKDAGIPIEYDAKIPADLATSQQQLGTIIDKMRAAGVNTMIMPEANSPLNFTHQAEAKQFRPDYYVWPCSGLDNLGMVRLFNAAQWTRAEGLTCYDKQFNADVANNGTSRESEWYKAYQDVAPGKDPPAPSPLVYMGLHQVIAGVSNAGRNLTHQTFRAGLDSVSPYRYDGIDGPTADKSNLLLAIGEPDRSVIGDCAYVRWDPVAREPGGSTQGTYVYPENRRYSKRSQF